MGKGIFRVTKKKWYYKDENPDKKYEVFKDLSKEINSYYYLENKDRKYIEDDDLVEKYIINNKKLNGIYRREEKNNRVQLFGKVTVYVKNNNKFEKVLLEKETNKIFYRKFTKERVNNKDIPLCYIEKSKTFAEEKKQKKQANIYYENGKGDFIFFEMALQEKILLEKRNKFIIEVEKDTYNILKFIEEKKYKYEPNKIRDKIYNLVQTINKYNLCISLLNKGKDDLIDSNSSNKILEIKGTHQKLSKLILEYLKKQDKNKEHLFQELNKYFYTLCKLLENKLRIYQKINKSECKTTINDIKNIEINKINKNIQEVLKNTYKLSELIKKVNSYLKEEKKKKKEKLDNFKELEIFNIIKNHYQNNFKEWKIEDKEEKYYIKYIHRYMLGRAKKIKEIIKYNGNISVDKIEEIFNETLLKEKIYDNIKNKIIVKLTEDETLNKYEIKNLNLEGIKPVLKVINTLKLKLIKSSYEAIVTGLEVKKDYNEIFSQATLEGFCEKIGETKKNIDFFQWAYLLRNYSLHSQEFNKEEKKNEEYIKRIEERFQKIECEEYSKANLVKFELNRIKSNNCINFIDLKYLIQLLDLIDLNKEKPSYLPRFSKIYKKIIFEKKENKNIEEKDEREQSKFYFYNLLYSYGFENLYPNILEKELFEKNKAEIEEIKNIGFFEFKQKEIISKNGKVNEIRKFEKKYIDIIQEIFAKILEKYKLDDTIFYEEKIKDFKIIQEIESKIENILMNKIIIPEKEFKILFLKSIYGTILLAKIEVKNEIAQSLQRFLSLIESLQLKYGYNNVNTILDKFLKKDKILSNKNTLDNFINELKNLIKNIFYKIKLEKYNMELDEIKAYIDDFTGTILKIYNLGKDGPYSKLEDIKYKRETKPQEKNIKEINVLPFCSDKVEYIEDRRILANNFSKNECNQKTLDYIVNSHISAIKSVKIAKLEYPTILNEITKYNKYIGEEEIKKGKLIANILFHKKEEKEEFEKELREKTIIQYNIKMRNEIQKYFKIEALKYDTEKKKNVYAEYFKRQKNDENFKILAQNLKVYNNRINKYNFYQKLMNLKQLIINKRLYRDYFNRMMTWVVQAEKTGIDLGGTRKKEAFKNIEKYLSNKIENPLNLRNNICHLNLYHKSNNDEGIKDIYLKFEKFNSYHVKKRNEVRTIENKILEKYNIIKIENEKYISKINTIYSKKNNFYLDLENISQQEVEYLIELLKRIKEI